MNLRRLTLRYMGWCPGIESAARFIPGLEINEVLCCVGMLYDLGVGIMVASIALTLTMWSEGISASAHPYGYYFLLGFLLELDAKLLYLTSYPPRFFERRSFLPEKASIIIGVVVCGVGLPYGVLGGQLYYWWLYPLVSFFAILPVIPYRLKLQKELQDHSARDTLLNRFFYLSLLGRAFMRIGMGPIMRRSFI